MIECIVYNGELDMLKYRLKQVELYNQLCLHDCATTAPTSQQVNLD